MAGLESPATAADTPLSELQVLQIVRRHDPRAQRLTAVDESGRKGRVYLVDDGIVLKTHRPLRLRERMVEEFETSVGKEAFLLSFLQDRDGMKTPRFLGYGREGRVEYVCMTRVSGVALRRLDLDGSQRARALRGVGRMLASVHALPQAALLSSGLFPVDATAAELRTRLQDLLGRVADAVNQLPREARPRADAREFAREALQLLPDELKPVALHSNPAGEHVFVDPVTGDFLGLIDFGDAFISHPAFDLRPWRRREDREALLEGYAEVTPPTAGFLAAMKAGMILGELANISRMRRPVEESERILAELVRGAD